MTEQEATRKFLIVMAAPFRGSSPTASCIVCFTPGWMAVLTVSPSTSWSLP